MNGLAVVFPLGVAYVVIRRSELRASSAIYQTASSPKDDRACTTPLGASDPLVSSAASYHASAPVCTARGEPRAAQRTDPQRRAALGLWYWLSAVLLARQRAWVVARDPKFRFRVALTAPSAGRELARVPNSVPAMLSLLPTASVDGVVLHPSYVRTCRSLFGWRASVPHTPSVLGVRHQTRHRWVTTCFRTLPLLLCRTSWARLSSAKAYEGSRKSL